MMKLKTAKKEMIGKAGRGLTEKSDIHNAPFTWLVCFSSCASVIALTLVSLLPIYRREPQLYSSQLGREHGASWTVHSTGDDNASIQTPVS